MTWRDFSKHPYHLILILVAYLPWLWAFQIPLTGDQKTYLAVAYEMKEQGSVWLPYLFGKTNYLKPPFQYWMTQLSWSVFGMNWFASLLPSVLALLGTSYLLSEIAEFLGGRRWYVSAGLWFAASLGAFSYAQAAQMDIWVCFWMTFAWYFALKFFSTEESQRKTRHLFYAFGAAGVLSWVKSPLYSVFFGTSFFLYVLSSGEWLLFREKRLLRAILFGVSIAVSWYIIAACLDFSRLWNQFFIEEQFNKGKNGITLGRLWTALLYQAFPFTLLMFVSLRAIIQGRRTSAVWRFAVCWMLPPALFFSLFPYKNTLYVFILVPALAILVDWALFRAFLTKTYRWAARISGGLVFFALLLFCSIAVRLGVMPWYFALLGSLMACASWALLWYGKSRGFVVLILLFYPLARHSSVGVMKHEIDSLQTAVETLKVQTQDRGAMLDEGQDMFHDIGLVQIHLGHGLQRLTNLDELVEFLDQGGYVILSEEQFSQFSSTLERLFIERSKKLFQSSWYRIQSRKKLKFTDLMRLNRESFSSHESPLLREWKILRVGLEA